MIKLYINYIRNPIINQYDNHETSVFVTKSGRRLTAADFKIKNVWKKAGKQSNLSTTNLRHVTTRVHEEHPERAQQMADHLKHGVHTATQI